MIRLYLPIVLLPLFLSGCGDNSIEDKINAKEKTKKTAEYIDKEDAINLAKQPEDGLGINNINTIGFSDPAPYKVRYLTGSARTRQISYTPMINQLAYAKNVDPTIIHAIISRESRYKPDAVSYRGAKGLMQLMPETGKEVGVSPFERGDPRKNVRGGIRYFTKGYKYLNENLQASIAGYNCGRGCASVLLRDKKGNKDYKKYGGPRLNGVPAKSFWKGETYNYVGYVTGFYNLYKANPQLIGLGYEVPSSQANARDLN